MITEHKITRKFIGGNHCLDFANAMEEWGTSYMELVLWSQQAGLLTLAEVHLLLQKAKQVPDEASDVLIHAKMVRQMVYQIFFAVANKHSPEAHDLAMLNDLLSHTLGRLLVVSTSTGFAWDWDNNGKKLDYMLWPVVRSAAELLTTPELNRVRVCAGDNCDQLFLDQTRNHSRRWCEMQHCGMLVKSRRYYAKKRIAKASNSEKTLR